MSQVITDAENIVNSIDQAPDPLRAELGNYYSQIVSSINGQSSPMLSKNFKTDKIKTASIETIEANSQVLIPIKRNKIKIEGTEQLFRDHTQWNQFINETITVGREFLDHTFSMVSPDVVNQFIKMPNLLSSNSISYKINKDYRTYEDLTKIYPSNQLLNYNLVSYAHDSQKIKDIGFIRTRFDDMSIQNISVDKLMREFENRIINYTGSLQEIERKQRNIFILNNETNEKKKTDFPFFFASHKTESPDMNTGLNKSLRENGKLKNLYQSLKNDLAFSNRSFTIEGSQIIGKIFNAIDILTSTSIVDFSEHTDEIFLLPESQVGHSNISERFVNQISSIKFISEMRDQVNNNSRTLSDIFNNKISKSFLLGYKIEKYLDNDAGQPIQTYYTTQSDFTDTQLKYGRMYIYKTKMLLGIFGSSYSYSNLEVAQTDHDEAAPTSKKYWATVDVQVTPSFQILEYEIDVHETAFVDTPSLPPHVSTHGEKNKSCVNFLFNPRNFTMGMFGSTSTPPVGDLLEGDRNIAELYRASGDHGASHAYFTGVYEIFRLDKAPTSKESFANGYLTKIDETAEVGNLYKGIPIKNIDIDQASFTEDLVPNQKYYYAFRTLTYHGTPSQLTEPIEVEVQQDSDEYKISIKRYHYPSYKDYDTEKSVKRLIRITPNLERLFFSKEEDANNWELDKGSLVGSSTSGNNKTFKIRATSKHTGKKIDLNITFKLNKDDTFNT